MAVVAAGSLLPTVEDWFSGRRELAMIEPLLTELARRQPDIGIGIRPRGPLVFRVAERLSLISDALFLEATAALAAQSRAGGTVPPPDVDEVVEALEEIESPDVSPQAQAMAVAQWILAEGDSAAASPARSAASFPGLRWLRQPDHYSDREWILEITRQYRDLDKQGERPDRDSLTLESDRAG
jgi:hypothetical protein